MCFCGCFCTQPWWRPCSVACTVTSHGQPKRRASLRAAPATSQSCEWTRSNESESPSAAPAARMSSFMASTQRTNASRSSFGNSGSRTRCTVTPWRSSTAARRPPPRASTWTSTPPRTSPSASLRTWRANPPSTIGGYSQDRMRTRIDTPGDDPTGPRLACPPPLGAPVPGRRRRPRCGPPGSTSATCSRGDPLPELGRGRRDRQLRRRAVGDGDRPLPVPGRGGRAAARGGRARHPGSRRSASAPSCSRTRSAAASGGCRDGR